MFSRLFLISILTLISGISFAQPALAWGQRYNGPPDLGDEALSIAVDAIGDSYVTGSAFAANGSLDIVTIKYSASGQQLWLQSYNGTGNSNDQGIQLVLDNSGNVYVTGFTNSATTLNDIVTIKYNSSGVQQWASLYNGSFNNSDQGNALSVDASGNVYVIGYETDATYTYNFVTIKYNSSGVQQWAQTYDGPGNFNDEGRDIALDANGNVYVTGPSDTLVAAMPNADMVLLKYNNSGTLQWRKVYDSSIHANEYSKKLAIDRNNNIIITGFSFITGNGYDILLLKWNAAGNFQWFRSYNYAANTFESPAGIVIDSLNNIIVTGQGITNTTANTNDYVTLKYDQAGTFQWASRYNGTGNGEDRGAAVALDDSLNIYVTGFSKGTSTLLDVATVKYDPSGNEKYVLRFNNVGVNKDDAGNAIAVRNGDIYVTGKSSNLGNDDYITLRYSYSAVGINELGNAPVSLEAFPNPASNEINIVIAENSNVNSNPFTCVISNALGQCVKICNPVSSESIGTKSMVSMNLEGLAPGIYFVKISRGNQLEGNAKFVIE